MKCFLPLPILVSAAISVTALRADGPVSPAAPPLSCRARSLDEAERSRHAELLARLRAAITEQHELPDGYAFRLGPRLTLADLSEWIGLERRCCAFFDFTVELRPGEDDLSLRLTGRGEVKAFIRAVVLAQADDGPRP